MENKWIYIAYAAAWVSMAVVVGICVMITQRIAPMWFMLFPLCVSMTSKRDDKGSKEEID